MIIPIAIDYKRNNEEKKLEKINLFLEITNFIYLFDFISSRHSIANQIKSTSDCLVLI